MSPVVLVVQNLRLVDLENEKHRLEMLALRKDGESYTAERQRLEVAARKEWLKVRPETMWSAEWLGDGADCQLGRGRGTSWP
jgi:hypothetical protein